MGLSRDDFTPSGVASTGAGRAEGNQKALARLHSARSLNRSHCYAAEGGGSFAAPTGHALSFEHWKSGMKQKKKRAVLVCMLGKE